MRILVTGGAGFIGSHIVDALVSHGHEVWVIDNLSTGKRINVNRQARFLKYDLTRPRAAKLIARIAPDVIHHLTAQMDVRKSVRDPAGNARINILALINTLQGASFAKTKTFIFASSGGVIYGEARLRPTPETSPLMPISPYGVAKLAGEHYGRYFGEQFGLRTVSLRYGNVFGPRQNPNGEAGVIAIFARKFLQGQIPLINGDGRNARDFVYVSDVVAANLAAQKNVVSGSFNIGTGQEININEIARLLQEITGSKVRPTHGPAKPGEQRHSQLDIRRARRVLGWRPRVSLALGLQKTVEWFKKNE